MARERDYSYEALTEVCGLVAEEITKDERGRVNAALKQLREIHTDDFLLADLIHDRANLYRAVYPDAALTPQALAGNWSQLPAKHEEWRKAQIVVTNTYAPLTECETCGGDKMVVYSVRKIEGGIEGHDHEAEELAPCPDCNSRTDAGFWRYDGTHFTPPSPAQIRARL